MTLSRSPMAANMTPASDPTQYLSNSNLLRAYTEHLRLVRSVDVRQGNLENVTGTVAFLTDGAGLIPAGTERTMFQDNLNQAANSGLIQTYADGNLFGGQIPSGQMLVLRGLGFSVESNAAAGISAADVAIFSQNVSVTVMLRGTPVYAGSPRDWPDVLGARGTGLGNTTQGQIPLYPAVLLEPLQDYAIRFRVERAITLSLAATNYLFHCRQSALRIYDPMVLGKS